MMEVSMLPYYVRTNKQEGDLKPQFTESVQYLPLGTSNLVFEALGSMAILENL